MINTTKYISNTFRGWPKHARNKAKMAEGRHIETIGKLNRHISAIVAQVVTKFGMITYFVLLNPMEGKILEIQYGGRPPSWKSKNRDIACDRWPQNLASWHNFTLSTHKAVKRQKIK